MPFSSLKDPVDLARAHAALEAAWDEVRPTIPDASDERERTRLAYIVAALLAIAEDEDDWRSGLLNDADNLLRYDLSSVSFRRNRASSLM